MTFIYAFVVKSIFHIHLGYCHKRTFLIQLTKRTHKKIYTHTHKSISRSHQRAEFVKKSNELKSSLVEQCGEEEVVIGVHKRKPFNYLQIFKDKVQAGMAVLNPWEPTNQGESVLIHQFFFVDLHQVYSGKFGGKTRKPRETSL